MLFKIILEHVVMPKPQDLNGNPFFFLYSSPWSQLGQHYYISGQCDYESCGTPLTLEMEIAKLTPPFAKHNHMVQLFSFPRRNVLHMLLNEWELASGNFLPITRVSHGHLSHSLPDGRHFKIFPSCFSS